MPWESRLGSSKLYFIQKQRIGGQLVSNYYGSGEAAQDIAQIEQESRQNSLALRQENSRISQALIALNAANESQFQAIEVQLIRALTAAGYHRQCRGPWRKTRTSNSVRTPNTENRTPLLAFDILTPIEPLLTARIQACRIHCEHINAIHESGLLHNSSLNRLYSRTAARAAKRLNFAEARLFLLHKLATGEK